MLQLIEKLFQAFLRNYKPALIGAGLVLLILWVVVKAYGITWSEFSQFLIFHKQQSEIVADQLDEVNQIVDEVEKLAQRNQQELVEIVLNLEEGQNNFARPEDSTEATYARILNMAAENQDLVRALMEFGRIYATLVRTKGHSEATLEYLSGLYEALWKITADDPHNRYDRFNSAQERELVKESGKRLCEVFPDHPICEAKKQLEEIESSIGVFPPSVLDDVKIEVLRYLSYTCTRTGEYLAAEDYTRKAELVLDRLLRSKGISEDEIEPELYRRKFWWIDYSEVLYQARNLTTDSDPEAENAIEERVKRMRRILRSEGRFLEIKLRQHKNFFEAIGKEDLWKKLVNCATSC